MSTQSVPKRVTDASYWWRTRVQPAQLSSTAKLVARCLAYAKWGRYTVAMTRVRLARRLGKSVRTIQRAIAELTAGPRPYLEVVEPGRIESGRRRCQVYRLLNPQVAKGDMGVSPTRGHRPKTTRLATIPAAHTSQNPSTRRTAAGRPDPAPGGILMPAGARPAGDGT